MGNSANWPLMQIITEASGGFYAAVSNRDDVLGQALLAKNKLTHQSLHDARLRIEGAAVSDTTDFDLGKVYRGQQLVIFGRYRAGAEATLELTTRIASQAKSFTQKLRFPDVAEEDPELERLWALEMIHATQKHALLGLMPEAEARAKVTKLGIDYQLVTDETSMIVLDDAGFEEHGVERKNRDRTSLEQDPAGTPPVASTPGASSSGRPSSGYSTDDGEAYGGALDPLEAVLLLVLTLALFAPLSSRRQRGQA
jgi:Ca-activated chloride channel family protein